MLSTRRSANASPSARTRPARSASALTACAHTFSSLTTFAHSILSSPCSPLPKPDPKAFAYGLPGADNILGEFDPLNFLEGKDQLEVYRLREAELAHGRVAMLASLGFIVQERFHPLFSGDGGPAIDQIPALPVWVWGVMLAGIAGAEQTRIAKGWAKLSPETSTAAQALRPGYYPGDLGFDPANVRSKNPGQLRLMQERELQNGRLAMLAAATFLIQEAVTGQTWGAAWGNANF